MHIIMKFIIPPLNIFNIILFDAILLLNILLIIYTSTTIFFFFYLITGWSRVLYE